MKHQPSLPEIKTGQSIELLKELHILTRDGKLNQDSRRSRRLDRRSVACSRCTTVSLAVRNSRSV